MALADLRARYVGARGALFWLALRTGVLTVLTAGFYRFWMKTRLRRYLWSAVEIGGVPLEYVGNPWEKLLGFLFAVVVLAFYIGVVNLALMFFSFSLFQTNAIAYVLSFVGVLPLLFFARYRARRYVLARTRWRGIRFGLEPGAWGYAWRAALHWLATIASLGILWPRKAFYLEKYLTDRTHFGDQKLHQGGRWTMLLPAMKHLYIGVGGSALAIGVAVGADLPGALAALAITLPWALVGLAYWRAHAFRLLTGSKEIGGAGLVNQARGGRVLGVWLGGYALTGLVVAAGTAAFFASLALFFGGVLGYGALLAALQEAKPAESAAELPLWAITVYGIFTYFASFLLWSTARQSFVTLPLARHFTETTRLTNPLALAHIRQRPRDAFAEAEGFADALDVGAAL